MQLGLVTKIKKHGNVKRLHEDVVSANCNIIIFFSDLWSIYSNTEAGFRTHARIVKLILNLNFH